MGLMGKSVRFVAGWLAAGTMLFAGIPHSDCVCPNGGHKPFCLSAPSAGGCCCGGACCSESEGNCCSPASEPPAEARGCCDREPGQQPEEAAVPHARLQGA